SECSLLCSSVFSPVCRDLFRSVILPVGIAIGVTLLFLSGAVSPSACSSVFLPVFRNSLRSDILPLGAAVGGTPSSLPAATSSSPCSAVLRDRSRSDVSPLETATLVSCLFASLSDLLSLP